MKCLCISKIAGKVLCPPVWPSNGSLKYLHKNSKKCWANCRVADPRMYTCRRPRTGQWCSAIPYLHCNPPRWPREWRKWLANSLVTVAGSINSSGQRNCLDLIAQFDNWVQESGLWKSWTFAKARRNPIDRTRSRLAIKLSRWRAKTGPAIGRLPSSVWFVVSKCDLCVIPRR